MHIRTNSADGKVAIEIFGTELHADGGSAFEVDRLFKSRGLQARTHKHRNGPFDVISRYDKFNVFGSP